MFKKLQCKIQHAGDNWGGGDREHPYVGVGKGKTFRRGLLLTSPSSFPLVVAPESRSPRRIAVPKHGPARPNASGKEFASLLLLKYLVTTGWRILSEWETTGNI